jgi:dihydroorotase
MEHVGSKELLGLLDKYENIYATITLHHLFLTLDDVVGGKLNPHNFCKPLVKLPSDREAIQKVVKSAHPKVMFGSDSAPHPLKNKLKGAAGIFSAPVLLPALAEFFEDDIESFQKFISDNARNNFKIEVPKKEVKLIKEEWSAPYIVGDIVPMWAGKTFKYKVL